MPSNSTTHSRNSILFIALLALSPLSASSQVEGLWIVEAVTVGDESVTPVARWSRFHADNTFQSGNGWLQNSQGVWQFDNASSEITVTPDIQFEEDLGPFKAAITDSSMSWERMEYDNKVVVQWKRIDAIPKAPADEVVGLWMRDVEYGSSDESLLVRWDRLYRFSDGKRRG